MYGDFEYLFPRSSGSEVAGTKSYTEREQFSAEFGWYNHLYEAAQGKLLDIGEILKLNARSFLMFCNYSIRKKQVDANEVRRKYRK